MKLKLLSAFVIIIFSQTILAQDSGIKGKVVDEQTGETLPGAVVMIEGTSIGSSTDLDGVFTINNIAPGKYTLVCKLISYNTKLLSNVIVKPDEPTILSLTMSTASTDLGIVEVVTTISKETTNAMLIMQKNNASVSDGISYETIRRTPDRNTSDVLKRISGASIQENKFAIIRGLNDRYNAAYINGAPLPSSESDRKAFAFDIFPSNMLDNLIITKTASPDMPGEFAGGIIQINTKSIPEKNEQLFSIAGNYNTITTFKNFKTYDGGKYDWMGIDDGTRALPSSIPATSEFSHLTLQEKGALAKQITPSWTLKTITALPALNLQYSIANVGKIFGHEAGSIFALTYQNNYNYNEIIRREYEEQSASVVKRMELNDKQYTKAILSSCMWNLTYKLNDNNQLHYKNLLSINSDDKVTIRHGAREFDQPEKQWEKSSLRWFTQNILYSGQLSGEHLFSKSQLKIKWVGGYSNIKRSVPNMRRIVYQKTAAAEDDAIVPYAAVVQNEGTIPNAAGNMFFSETNEKISSIRYEASYPLKIKAKTEIKAGGFHQFRDRSFSARNLGFSKYRQGSAVKFNSQLLLLPEEEIFASSNMGMLDQPGPYNGGFKLDEATKTSDSYTASSLLNAGFAMFDTKFFERLRAIYGLRLESYNQQLHTIKDGSNTPIVVDTTVNDFLPSVNLIYSLTEKINIRGSYYRTVSRPEFRELAPFIFYDFVTDFAISGNSDLKRALIDNYDLRFEYYPGAGQLISVSGFYKEFTNAIEQASRPDVIRELYYVNVPKATNIGMEIEYRFKLSSLLGNDSSSFFSSTTLYTNFSYIRSKVDVRKINGVAYSERPLQGQSPVIINAGIQYIHPSNGWSLSASYNMVGKRIYIVGSVSEPDYWEKPRNVIDIQIAKRIKEHLEIKLNVRDLLAQNLILYQDIDRNGKYDEIKDNTMINSNFGQTVSLTINYKL